MSKHTPWPWDTANDGRDVIQAATGYTICEASGNADDARLIAAAPEMLEAMKRLLGAMSAVNYEWDPSCEYARAIIAKIEGDE